MTRKAGTCDVAVVGAGAAGLRAAAVAASAGASSVVIDGYDLAGGQYFRQPATEAARRRTTKVQAEGRRWVDEAVTAGAELRQGTSVWHACEGELHLTSVGGVSVLRHRALVIATGAHERAVAFPGWTLPGVVTAGALQALVKEHGIVPGRRVLFAGTGPLSLVVAATVAATANVAEVAEVAEVLEANRVGRFAVRHPWRAASGVWRQGDRLSEGARSLAALRRRRVPVRQGWGIVRALGAGAVEGAVVARLDGQWRPIAGTERTVECDTIAVHHSLVPSTELLRLVGAAMVHRPELGGWVPECTDDMATSVPEVFAAGDCTGIGGVAMSLVEGEIAGAAAVGEPPTGQCRLRRERRFQRLYGELFAARPGLSELADVSTVVCRCEEATRADLDAALARGATSAATAKSLSRCGMGPCQGRVCGPQVAQLVEQAVGAPQEPFTARPPLVPLPLASLVGEPTA